MRCVSLLYIIVKDFMILSLVSQNFVEIPVRAEREFHISSG